MTPEALNQTPEDQRSVPKPFDPQFFAEGEKNSLLAAIVESSTDAIISKDLNGIIRSWNAGARQIFGYSAEEVIGKPVSILAPPDRQAEMAQTLARIQRGERVTHYDTVRRRKDGQDLQVSLTVSPVRNQVGEIVGASKILRDITEAKQMEEALRLFDRQIMLLAEASGALLSSPQSSDVISIIVDLAQRFGSGDAYAVWRQRSEDGVWILTSSAGLSDLFVRTGITSSEEALLLPHGPLLFENILEEPMLAHRKEALVSEGIRSMLVVPLFTNNKATGTVVFYWKTRHSFLESEIRIASALANLAASALGTAEHYDRERELRLQAQMSEQRASFLAQAGAALAASLDYETTLRNVAKLAIPNFADWCAVDVEVDGSLRRVTVEHADPAKVQLAQVYRQKYPPREDDPSRIAFRTGQPILVGHITEEAIRLRIQDPEQLKLVREMGLASFIVAPMVNRGRTLGLLTFVSSRADRRYTQADLILAEELARRAATAVENASLYANVRASEERYRSLVSATTSVVWVVNPEGEFVQPQASWEAYTGQNWEEYRGFGWANAVHPDDREQVKNVGRLSRALKKTYQTEGRLWHAASQEYRHYVGRAAPVLNHAGEVFEWIGTITDVHEAKQAEEERNLLLLREQRALNTAQLLNRVGPVLSAQLDPRRLSESITELATKLVDAEFGALFHNLVNENGETYTLYTLSGVPYEAFKDFPMPRNTAVFGPTFRGESVVRSDDITQDPRYGKSGPYHGMPPGHLPVRSYLAVPVVSRSGVVLGGLFFGHSQPGMFQEAAEELVTGIASQAAISLDNASLFAESQKAQDALRSSNEELQRVNEDLNHFAYSASHDLQEPLRMVSAYTQLLQKRYGDRLDSQADQYISYAVQGAQRMELLIRDILAYTQTAATPTQVVEPVNLNDVMGKVLSNLQQAIDKSGAVVTYQTLPCLNVQGMHLSQLFQNLIGNAIKYGSKRSPVVTISAVRQDSEWLMAVKDNGIGIDPQYKEQVFGLFKRLHTADEYDGTGIGLAICQKIVTRYGGRIWVESTLGQGATFYFTIPDRA